eukprot:TRINITY_DN799_c1_g1_i1.p1 TRINITY_DN799_c1_g1~~TRINITY_DN799_c1_g1_i1.p1  ORF type:complete len:241 (-),score=55.87 TRINITY_DN799_c1_g1_i1:130-852(-)
MKKVVIVLTNNGFHGEHKEHLTGWYLPEAAHPYHVFKKTGKCEIILASPLGGEAPLDPSSISAFGKDEVCSELLKDEEFTKAYKNTVKLDDIDANTIDVLFYAGGSGTMWDLPNSEVVIRITQQVYENKRNSIVAAVCHGPCALTNVKTSDGKYLVEGKNLTGFSNAEELVIEQSLKVENYCTKVLPFLLEDRLKERGGKFSKAEAMWGSHAVIDNRLVTGQNPGSSTATALEIVKYYGL